MLYHIKKILGVGSVSVAKDGMAEYRIRDKRKILKYIIPLFDTHLLLTSKFYHYQLFKEALFISMDTSLSKLNRQELLTALQ